MTNVRDRIRYIHLRRPNAERTLPLSRGGLTIAYQEDEATNKIKFAVAECSDKDNFSRKTGRNIASARLRHLHNQKYWHTFFPAEAEDVKAMRREFHYYIIDQMFGDYLCYSKKFALSS